MKIKISCSLEGRDLAVVKSLLNIKHEYGDHEFSYSEDKAQSHFLIVKDYLDEGAVFYALSLSNGIKTPILPTLNPNSLKDLFGSLSDNLAGTAKSVDELKEIRPIENVLLDYIHSDSAQLMIVSIDNNLIVLDRMKNMLHTTNDLVDPLNEIDKLLKSQVVKFCNHIKEVEGTFDHTLDLNLFCWNLGVSIESRLVSDTHLKDPKYKLVTWPNFGSLPFENEFIQLSSLIWKRAETFSELQEHTDFCVPTINKYLNAALLARYVVTVSNDEAVKHKYKKQKNGFLNGLKKAFGF